MLRRPWSELLALDQLHVPGELDFPLFDCTAFADDTTINYSVITKEDTSNAAKNVYIGCAGSNNGKTLIVFTFSDDICLTKTSDGRQFGPSVLAPFSNVALTNSGY